MYSEKRQKHLFPSLFPFVCPPSNETSRSNKSNNRTRGQRRRLAGNCIPGADSPPLVQRNEKYRSVIHQSSAAAIVPSACPLFRVCAITGSARSVRRQFLPCLEREHGAGRLPPGSLTDGYTSIPPERKSFPQRPVGIGNMRGTHYLSGVSFQFLSAALTRLQRCNLEGGRTELRC